MGIRGIRRMRECEITEYSENSERGEQRWSGVAEKNKRSSLSRPRIELGTFRCLLTRTPTNYSRMLCQLSYREWASPKPSQPRPQPPIIFASIKPTTSALSHSPPPYRSHYNPVGPSLTQSESRVLRSTQNPAPTVPQYTVRGRPPGCTARLITDTSSTIACADVSRSARQPEDEKLGSRSAVWLQPQCTGRRPCARRAEGGRRRAARRNSARRAEKAQSFPCGV